MRFLRLSELEPSAGERVFRYSPARAALLFLGLAFAGAALVVGSAHYIAYYVAGVLFLSLVLFRRFLLARLRPSNWLVRMRSDGLCIHFRSYLNYHLPEDDLTMVFFPFQEIRSARVVRERTKVPDGDGATTVQTRRLVELEVAGDLEPLAKILSAEFARIAPRKKTWYGSTSSLHRHYPVRIAGAPFLRMEWTVVPGANKFLDALRPHTTIAPPVAVPEDFTNLSGLSRLEQEDRLRELDRRGRTIAAVYIARRLYGCDVTEAQAVIARLRAKV